MLVKFYIDSQRKRSVSVNPVFLESVNENVNLPGHCVLDMAKESGFNGGEITVFGPIDEVTDKLNAAMEGRNP